MSSPNETLTVELTREMCVALCWVSSARWAGRQAKQQPPPADVLLVAARDKLADVLGAPDEQKGMTG